MSLVKSALILVIDFYRTLLSFDRGLLMLLAPGGACQQTPSCSLYTREAIIHYGALKGLKLGVERIINCR